ncbi:MAG: AMP-binding protein, partial [Acetobacteraceae bacterium]|nr:AMP-binding protein [Acetobacteraceae bacterium]
MEDRMLGLMQDRQLMIADILVHAARHHGTTDIVSRTDVGTIHRTTYAQTERRARRLARALTALGIGPSDRVGTLAWNGFRHLELYYGVSGTQAVCHTINPRLSPDELVFILNHANDRVLFADPSLASLVGSIVPRSTTPLRAVVFMCEPDEMPDVALPGGMDVLCYESMLRDEAEDFAWPVFGEGAASSLCYTSGTTGQPKGVLYSHRSTVLHALATIAPDAFGFRALDRVMPVVPMFHVNAWGVPYAAPMAGAALVLPGRHLDGAALVALMNAERVTIALGIPTIWTGVLHHLRENGERLETVEKLSVGGSACPLHLAQAFERE